MEGWKPPSPVQVLHQPKSPVLIGLKGKLDKGLIISEPPISDRVRNDGKLMFYLSDTPSKASTLVILELSVHVCNRDDQCHDSLRFLGEQFSVSIENNNYNHIYLL